MADFAKLIKELKEKGLTIGAVESFTAGLFSSRLGEIPGASSVFRGSLIAYAPELKVSLAGVKAETIRQKGVVSQEVALEMAVGGRKALDVDICVSFTGDAGPSLEKGNDKVGEAYLCVATARQNIVLHPRFKGERNAIRASAADMACEYLITLLEKGSIA